MSARHPIHIIFFYLPSAYASHHYPIPSYADGHPVGREEVVASAGHLVVDAEGAVGAAEDSVGDGESLIPEAAVRARPGRTRLSGDEHIDRKSVV